MSNEFVTLPRALIERVSDAMSLGIESVAAMEYLSKRTPESEVTAGLVYALRAITGRLDAAIGSVADELHDALKTTS